VDDFGFSAVFAGIRYGRGVYTSLRTGLGRERYRLDSNGYYDSVGLYLDWLIGFKGRKGPFGYGLHSGTSNTLATASSDISSGLIYVGFVVSIDLFRVGRKRIERPPTEQEPKVLTPGQIAIKEIRERREREGRNRPTTSNVRRIRMTRAGGVYTVPIKVNDVLDIHFVLDTGASDVVVSPQVALTLWQTGTVAESDFLGNRTYRLADGRTVISPRFRLRSLEIGGIKLRNVPASVSDSVEAPMLLGQSALERFGAYTVENGVLVIRPK
jgi:aspartyl protease family protein